EGSILFIDEIHRMPRVVEEFIYPAMEDYRADIVLGEGVNARTISLRLKHFTLIGATTRSGMLSGPMRDRFKIHEHLEFYSVEELAEIVRINSAKLQTPITAEAAVEMARRSRGTPRIANSRLCWTRHYATSEADGRITLDVARAVHRPLAARADRDDEGVPGAGPAAEGAAGAGGGAQGAVRRAVSRGGGGMAVAAVGASGEQRFRISLVSWEKYEQMAAWFDG